ncbi:MAG TPA: glutathione S-transferase family protein [Solirubrobacteraceae bacterium]|jgi:glutathione S-transferase
MRLFDYAASCNCYKVRLLLAQLERECELVPTDIFAGETLTPEFAARNPARTTPVLELDDGRNLPESAAILTYLAMGTPLLPDDPLQKAEVVGWLAYEQAEVIPAVAGLRFRLQTGRLAPDDPGAESRRRAGRFVLDTLERHLAAAGDYFVGDRYSIADIALYGYLHVAEEAGYELHAHRRLDAWRQRVREQPRHMNDVAPYPANAAPGAGRSIYDLM